jgi:murein L,D-transpeptidase YcbB/YkuD
MIKETIRRPVMSGIKNIAIIGSERYENQSAIRDFIFKIKQNLGDNVSIITRGFKNGTEKYVKKFAIDMGMRYVEYNPAHTPHNLYSGMAENYYDKEFHPTQALHQYKLVVDTSDLIFYFGTIKPSDRKYFERVLTQRKKKVTYLID